MSLYDHYSEKEIAVLRRRAARIVGVHQTAAEGELLSVLLIMTGDETCALSMDALSAVYEGMTIVPVPNTPPFIAGMTSVRGQILPVLDLATLLGITSTGERQALLVVEHEEMTVGLCAETIGEAALLRTDSLQAVTAATDSARRDYVQGVTPQGIALLNLDAILNDPSIIVDETID